MKESLARASFTKFKSNPASYVAVGLMCGLFLILTAIFALINPSLLIIAIPLIGMPFLFASHVACYYLTINQPITISSYFRYFAGFFRAQFRGSFRGIISFLKSLAFYFASAFIAGIIVYCIFKAYYGNVFTDSLNELAYQYVNSIDYTYEDIMMLLYENDNLLLTFIFYISAFAIPVAMLAFIYHISFSSISIYYRTNVITTLPLLKMSINFTYAKHRHAMRKDWFKLNWPMLVLSLLGMVAFALINLLIIRRADLLPAFVMIGGVSLLMFYLPLYFANMETIYRKYESYFRDGNQEAIAAILQRIQDSIDLSEEEKRNLEESLKGLNDNHEEEQ